jgi:iron complex outermembrane recepter protein
MSKRSWSLIRNGLIPPCVIAAMTMGLASAYGQTADAPAGAAAATPSGLEEIVITAERRATNLQTTALAISAIRADTLQKENVSQLADINGRIPSLEITKASGYETDVSIRGVGIQTPENALTTSPGVAMFIDGVYIANTISLDQTLFDLDHIEVLRGPQGALYGQSSTAGAIIMVTKQPKLDEFSGTADVSLGDYDLHREQAELNIPVSDQFALRLSAQNYGHDGFTKDIALPNHNLDDANDVSGKIAALWQPTDEFKATLTTQFYSSDFDGAAQKNINDPNPNPYVVTQDYPARFALNTNVSHLNLEYELPWFTIKSVTAYQWLDHHQQEDSSRSAFALTDTYDDVAGWNTHLQNFNEEVDFLSNPGTDFDWITGIFASSQKTRQFVAEFECPSATVFACSAPTPSQVAVSPDIETHPPANLVFGQDLRVDRQAYAWFGQGTYHITDDLRFTTGVRINYDGYSTNTLSFATFPKSPGPAHQAGYWDLIPTWRAELEYDLTPDNMLYASFSRGYKPGGINVENAQNGGAVLATPTFNPETNTSFEIGSKNLFFDKTLRANFAAFYYVYRNMQYIATDPEEFAGGIENIPSTHIWGGEAELNYTGLEQRLHLDGSLSLLGGKIEGNYSAIDSTIQQHLIATVPACMFGGAFFNPACFKAEEAADVNISGNSPAQLPNVLGSIALSYDFQVPTGTLTPRVDYIYRGTLWQRIFNQPGVDSVPAYSLVNLNFEYIPTDSNLTVQFTVSNLFDKAGVNSRYTDPYGTFTTSQQFVPPRQFIGTVSYSFGAPTSQTETATAYVPPPAVAPAPSVPNSYLVFFDFNKSDLTPRAVGIVDAAAKNAGPAKVTQLTVTGHTDTVGSDAYNMRLSRRRAESVAAQLEKDGIPSSEIAIVAKGKRDLLVPTADGVKEPQNRRVQIVYSGGPTS